MIGFRDQEAAREEIIILNGQLPSIALHSTMTQPIPCDPPALESGKCSRTSEEDLTLPDNAAKWPWIPPVPNTMTTAPITGRLGQDTVYASLLL